MSYITTNDMIAAFGSEEIVAVTNLDDPSRVEINEAILERAIADAQSQVDAYLRSRYVTPIDPTPDVLKRITCDLTRGILDQNNPREEVVRRWEAAIAFLKDVARGLANLPGEGAAKADVGEPEMVSARATFTLDSLRDY